MQILRTPQAMGSINFVSGFRSTRWWWTGDSNVFTPFHSPRGYGSPLASKIKQKLLRIIDTLFIIITYTATITSHLSYMRASLFSVFSRPLTFTMNSINNDLDQQDRHSAALSCSFWSVPVFSRAVWRNVLSSSSSQCSLHHLFIVIIVVTVFIIW